MEPIAHGQETSNFAMLCRMLKKWRFDKDRLAVVVRACQLVGWGSWGISFELEHGFPYSKETLSKDAALELVQAALYRRNKKLLEHRARGLLLAIQELAQDAEFAELHRKREDAAVIECRELSIEERIEKLRAMEAG